MINEFWAAIVGAIVGSISAGLITWFLQWTQDSRQTLERNRGLARSLLFKLMRIHSDLQGFKNHSDEALENAKRDRLPEGWQSLRAIGNLPDRVNFTPDEMSYLLSLQNYKLFEMVVSLDVVHSSTIGIFELYKERRLALTDMLSAAMQGHVGETVLTDEQKAFFDPKAAELDLLVSDIRSRVLKDAQESMQALVETNEAISKTLGHKLQVEIAPAGQSLP